MRVLPVVLTNILEKLGDSKVVIRQTAMKLLSRSFQLIEEQCNRPDRFFVSTDVVELASLVCNELEESRAGSGVALVSILPGSWFERRRCLLGSKRRGSKVLIVYLPWRVSKMSNFALPAQGKKLEMAPTANASVK